MKIEKGAVAGTLESSDCLVAVEPGSGSVEFELVSDVIHQFGHSIRKTVMETLDRLGVNDIKIHITDKGALDCTIKARVECAVFRSNSKQTGLPWGGAIR